MMAVVGSSFMARASEEQGGYAAILSNLLSTRRSQEECGTGSGQGPTRTRGGSTLKPRRLTSGEHDIASEHFAGWGPAPRLNGRGAGARCQTALLAALDTGSGLPAGCRRRRRVPSAVRDAGAQHRLYG